MVDIVNLPDFFGAAQRGIQTGRETNEYVRGEKNRALVDELAPQIMAGDQDAYTQAAVADKGRADDYQGEHVKQLKQLSAAGRYMQDALKTGDKIRIQAAWQSGARPFLQRLVPGKPIPEEWSDEMVPALEQAMAMTASVGAIDDSKNPANRVQSRYTDSEGNVIALMGDGSRKMTGDKAAPNIKILEQEGQVPTGYVTSGGKAGEAVQLGGGQPTQAGAPAAQAPPVQGANPNEGVVTSAANAMIAAGVPEAQVDAWVQQQLSAPVATQAPAGSNIQTSQIVTGGPARTPTSAEKKRDETAATGTMQTLSADEVAANGLPEGTFAQRNALTGEIKVGPASAQRNPNDLTPAQKSKLKKDAAKTKSAIRGTEQAMDLLDKTVNHILANEDGLKGVTGLQGMFPNIPGGDAANAQADINSLKSKVFTTVLQNMRNNSPTGGAVGNVSDREGDKMEANIAALENAQSYEQFRDRLKELLDFSEQARKNVNAAYEDQFGEAEKFDDQPATDDISDLLTKYPGN